MKSKSKQHNNSLKLPQIGNRTMEKFDNDNKQKVKQRPNSSKNILIDLEKKLFSQLNTYEQIPTTKSKTIRSKKHIQSAKDSKNDQADIGMHKIAELMPQLYSKIIQCKKYDNVESEEQYSHTLKEKNMTNFKQFNLSEELTLDFNDFKKQKTNEVPLKNQNKLNQIGKRGVKKQKSILQKPTLLSATTSTPSSTGIESNVIKMKIQKEAQDSQMIDASQFKQGQEEDIYQSYLKSQGLGKQTSMQQLKKINEDLLCQEVDIQSLQASYSTLIQTLGHLCIDDNI